MMSARRHLAPVLAVLAIGLGAAGIRVAVDEPTAAAQLRRGNEVAPTTTTVAALAPTTTLPQPLSPAGEDYIDEPIVEIGRLQIPALGVDEALYQGISLTSIDHGPSQWTGSALPGHLGNVVVAGHRVTHSKPFRHLDQLMAGDQATFITAEGTFNYEFTGTEIIEPERVDIIDQTAEYRATFFACHPPGSARQRIVAHWRLVSAPIAT